MVICACGKMKSIYLFIIIANNQSFAVCYVIVHSEIQKKTDSEEEYSSVADVS